MSDAVADWERHAAWWQRDFTDGVDAEYTEQILPLAVAHLVGVSRLLDVGCGEGQLARAAAAAGVGLVLGVDPTDAQIIKATVRAGGPRYVRAAGSDLPVVDGGFDAVVACLVFEHIDDVDDAIAEVGRVLAPGGRFLFFLNHPLLQAPNSGWIDDHVLDPPEQYWRVGSYLDEIAVDETVAPGVEIRFIHRPLHRYVNAMADADLFITTMAEPPPPPGFLARASEYVAAASIPRLLFLRAEKAT